LNDFVAVSESIGRPAARSPRIRWGLPDVAIAWFVGLTASLLALPLADPGAPQAEQPTQFILATVLLQDVGVVATLIVISRAKGRGSLRLDFGLVWPSERLATGTAMAWVAAGMAVSVVAQALLAPISALADLDEPAQQVSQSLESASGVGRLLFALTVVCVAPPVEELLFRGGLLRGLQRRWKAPVAVFASATIFSMIHVVGDPGAVYVVPGVMLLGLVAGFLAVRDGNLARATLLHVGFNLLGAIGLLLA